MVSKIVGELVEYGHIPIEKKQVTIRKEPAQGEPAGLTVSEPPRPGSRP
jgi:hypothetical protein